MSVYFRSDSINFFGPRTFSRFSCFESRQFLSRTFQRVYFLSLVLTRRFYELNSEYFAYSEDLSQSNKYPKSQDRDDISFFFSNKVRVGQFFHVMSSPAK